MPRKKENMALPIIAVTNESTVIKDAEVIAALPKLQRQVSFDFKAWWSLDCALEFWPRGQQVPGGWWQIVIVNDPDQAGALGYHELAANGCPLGKVFAGLDLKLGCSWTVTLSHELLEMLADPYIDRVVQGQDGKLYALEVCDPVEADDLGYFVENVLVSDFITPKWFHDRAEGEYYSFKRNVARPLQLAAGGYIGVLDANGAWTVQTAQRGAQIVVPEGSRRQRRRLSPDLWRKSERRVL